MENRKEGYYWVQIKTKWIIAEWFGDYWMFSGSGKSTYKDPDFFRIEETPINRLDKPDFTKIADEDPSILNHDTYTGFIHGCELGWKYGRGNFVTP